jgi:anionic cell wall polymer biosynthesis LytR-Cps2A-Psr (LCP) family protein
MRHTHQPKPLPAAAPKTPRHPLLRAALWFTFLVLSLVFWTAVLTGVIAFKTYRYASAQWELFSSESGVSFSELKSLIKQGVQDAQTNPKERITILLLGVDTLAGRPDEGILTDSIVLASVSTQTGTIDMISIPRDLWIEEYRTKINAFLYYGRDKYPNHPEQYTKEVVEQITGVTIDHTIVLDMNTVAAFVDTLGYVEIEVPQAFTDTQFPRPGVDVAVERDPEVLYMTVTFDQGKQKMDGARVLEYIRSRKSENAEEGSDDARSLRQQQVILALTERVKNIAFSLDMKTAGRLYKMYDITYGEIIPIPTAISYGYQMKNSVTDLKFQSHTVLDLLKVPPITKHKQWVYEPSDPSWGEMKKNIQSVLSK